MLALPFVLPLNAVRKALLLGYGLAAMVLSSDKRYKLRPNGGRPAGSELVAKKRVVFVRHGESVWNEMWNKGFMPPGFPYRVGKGLLQEVLLFASRDSVLLDSCLNAKGTRQGRALADFVARTPAEELEVMPERARRDLAALRGGAGVPEGGVVRCSSNLRRAIATACLVAPEAVAEAPMEVLSSLQEISVNVDTLSLTPAGQAPLLEDGVPQPETWGQGGNTGNKALFGRGDARLAAFAAWCAARPEEYVVVGGHSLVFREFFKRYLPAASAFPGKSRKMINCGVVAFDLEVFADGEAFVDEASVEVVYGGFEGGKKKGGLKAQLKKLGMAALCVGAAMALRVVLGPGRHAQVSLPFGL